MTGFKLRTSGIGSNRSTNWATTTAQGHNHCPSSSNSYIEKIIFQFITTYKIKKVMTLHVTCLGIKIAFSLNKSIQ